MTKKTRKEGGEPSERVQPVPPRLACAANFGARKVSPASPAGPRAGQVKGQPFHRVGGSAQVATAAVERQSAGSPVDPGRNQGKPRRTEAGRPPTQVLRPAVFALCARRVRAVCALCVRRVRGKTCVLVGERENAGCRGKQPPPASESRCSARDRPPRASRFSKSGCFGREISAQKAPRSSSSRTG